jgi:gentisate 1,2-dioxygenase
MSMKPARQPMRTERRDYYQRIKPLHLTPLWEELHALVPREPNSPCVAALWRYADIRPLLMESADLITAEEAVRRVLVLENPALPGRSSITQSLYAGLQLIMPGEVAPSHRHVQSALRFIVDGRGAYTTVGGERTTMQPGDFIITPELGLARPWQRRHCRYQRTGGLARRAGHPAGALLRRRLRRERHGQRAARVAKPEGNSYARFGYNMAPVRHSHTSATSPIFSYPYDRSREALTRLQRDEPADAWQGWKLRYVNPLTGGAPMPTISTYLQLLPRGFKGKDAPRDGRQRLQRGRRAGHGRDRRPAV